MHYKKTISFPPQYSNIQLRKIRSLLCSALTIVLLFILCSCGSGSSNTPNHSPGSSEVPEQLIKDIVDYKYGRKDYYYTAEHNVDNSTHIDTVTIKVVINQQYHKEHITGTCKYRYNKSNDTWDIYNQPVWKTEHMEYLAHKFTTTWDGKFKNSGGSYNANITSVDFENGTITGRFSASYTSMSLSGSQHLHTLEAEGTYTIEEDIDGYRLRITQSGYTFTFSLGTFGFSGIVVRAI